MANINVRNRNKNIPGRKPNWEYRIEIAQIGEKRKSISKSGFKTKKEALDAGTEVLANYNNSGKTFTSNNISVSDFLDYWIINYAEVNLAYATVEGYKNIIKNHLKPRIGMYRLKTIDTITLQMMINNIFNNNNFSKAFMKNILKVTKGVFKYAKVTAHMISDNPATDVVLPRYSYQEPKTRILSKEEIIKIFERFKNAPHQYYALLIGYYTGLRVSEVYGLTWDCIDFENKEITVNKIVKRLDIDMTGIGHGGILTKSRSKWFLGDCKTATSYRTIKIGDTLLEALKQYKLFQERNKMIYGSYYLNHYLKEEMTKSKRKVYRIISVDNTQETKFDLPKVDLVMVKENGEFHGTDTMKYPQKIAREELGINFQFHELRHTHATRLIESGAPIKDVQNRMGHSSINTTMNIYVENTKKMQEKSVELFEKDNLISINITQRNERLYDIYKSMVNRCKTNDFYVKREITICEEWLKSYDNFAKWAEENSYDDTLYLERKNKLGNYCPENCIWASLHDVKSHKYNSKTREKG